MSGDILGHDPTDATVASQAEQPPEHLESFPTESLMGALGEVAHAGQASRSLARRSPSLRILPALFAAALVFASVWGLVNALT